MALYTAAIENSSMNGPFGKLQLDRIPLKVSKKARAPGFQAQVSPLSCKLYHSIEKLHSVVVNESHSSHIFMLNTHTHTHTLAKLTRISMNVGICEGDIRRTCVRVKVSLPSNL